MSNTLTTRWHSNWHGCAGTSKPAGSIPLVQGLSECFIYQEAVASLTHTAVTTATGGLLVRICCQHFSVYVQADLVGFGIITLMLCGLCSFIAVAAVLQSMPIGGIERQLREMSLFKKKFSCPPISTTLLPNTCVHPATHVYIDAGCVSFRGPVDLSLD